MKIENSRFNSVTTSESAINPEGISNITLAAIVPVVSGHIGERETRIVSARALHTALDSKRDFTSWIKKRIADYGFTDGTDYQVVENLRSPNLVSAKSRQQITHDYVITLNMAKELAMVERTEQGRAMRQYFIQCEEALQKVAPQSVAALRKELAARITVASLFKPMCVALKLSRCEQGKATEPYHYTTESNLISRLVLGGLTAKQWATLNGYDAKKARDHMSTAQPEHMAYLESSNITLIELGQDYQQRKAKLVTLSQRWLALHTGAGHE